MPSSDIKPHDSNAEQESKSERRIDQFLEISTTFIIILASMFMLFGSGYNNRLATMENKRGSLAGVLKGFNGLKLGHTNYGSVFDQKR